MHYKADLDSNLNSLEWLEILEECFPYVDNIVRNPKVALITETEVQKIEKAKKIGVERVKDLAKHTNYIEKIEKNRDKGCPRSQKHLFHKNHRSHKAAHGQAIC